MKSENKFDPVRGGRPQIVLEGILVGEDAYSKQGNPEDPVRV